MLQVMTLKPRHPSLRVGTVVTSDILIIRRTPQAAPSSIFARAVIGVLTHDKLVTSGKLLFSFEPVSVLEDLWRMIRGQCRCSLALDYVHLCSARNC